MSHFNYRKIGVRLWFVILVALSAWLVFVGSSQAGDGRVYHCSSSEQIYSALKVIEPGDTIMLEGGRVYELEESLALKASGTEDRRISLTSEDSTGKGPYAVLTTVDGRKEDDMVAIKLDGAFWNLSRLEISGRRVPLDEGFWDTHGFRLGLFLNGPDAHHNVVEDMHIHHTHNAAVAVRDRSHQNTFRRMKIHDLGEWLSKDYNAHEGEGFYIGSSKGYDENENRAVVHDILIEDSVLGPGLLGQYVDLKYGSSKVMVRNNTLHCGVKSYNEEIVKLAGYANTITGNRFVGSAENLTRYIHVFNKKTRVPVRVDYLGQKDIEAPTGRDNTIVDNIFYTDNPEMVSIQNDLAEVDRASLVVTNNKTRPLDDYKKSDY